MKDADSPYVPTTIVSSVLCANKHETQRRHTQIDPIRRHVKSHSTLRVIVKRASRPTSNISSSASRATLDYQELSRFLRDCSIYQ